MKTSRQNRFKRSTPPLSKIPHSLFYHGHELGTIPEEKPIKQNGKPTK